jgi:hypothetical protein
MPCSRSSWYDLNDGHAFEDPDTSCSRMQSQGIALGFFDPTCSLLEDACVFRYDDADHSSGEIICSLCDEG